MNKRFLLAICVTAASVSALIFSSSTYTTGTYGKDDTAQTVATMTPQVEELPEHVPYMFLFEHLRHLKKKSDEFKSRGQKSGSSD